MSRGLSHLLINYSVGDKVVVVIDPREHNTTPHRRFQGRVGQIKEIGRRTVKVIRRPGIRAWLHQKRRAYLV